MTPINFQTGERVGCMDMYIIIIRSQYNRFFIYSNDSLLQVSPWYVPFKGNSFITCLSCK